MKSLQSRPQHAAFTKLLVEIREGAGITQVQLAERLRIRQSDVSKIERGVRRLDVVELHGWLRALGMPIAQFATVLDERLVATSALEEAWEPGTVMGTPLGKHRGARS